MSGSGRRIRVVTGAAALCVALTGCGSVLTYNQAMQLRSSYYDFHFEPPDSEAFALPPVPPVYAVVFKEGFYVPPEPVVLPAHPARVRKDSTAVPPAVADTVAAPILLPPPPQVQVDLTPSQEADLIARARRDIGRADSLLTAVSAVRGDRTTLEQVEAARGLLRQAEAALARKDFQGAANLAQKARVLAETLSAGRP
jgi:hypothetical protein